MPTAPNASIYIYRACVNLYLFLFFPPQGALKLAYGESTTALKLPQTVAPSA